MHVQIKRRHLVNQPSTYTARVLLSVLDDAKRKCKCVTNAGITMPCAACTLAGGSSLKRLPMQAAQ